MGSEMIACQTAEGRRRLSWIFLKSNASLLGYSGSMSDQYKPTIATIFPNISIDPTRVMLSRLRKAKSMAERELKDVEQEIKGEKESKK
jgi:hypothetical protein